MPAPSDFLPRIKQMARDAGALLQKHAAQRVAIEYKGDVDIVTVADRETEQLVMGRIRSEWPDHDVLGEEGTRRSTGSDFMWYVDPLDGTTNFAHGFLVYCVSIALEYRGELFAGVVYDPSRDELFAAGKGEGATVNGRPLRVSATKTLRESLLGTGFPAHKRHKNPNIHFYHQITMRSHGVRRAGSAALDLANTAAGRFDGFWEFNLNPWDVAAGALLVTEAGGKMTDMRGGKFDHRAPGETLASNGLITDELVGEFGKIFAGAELEPLPGMRQ